MLSFFLISLRSILILSCTFTLSFRNRFFSLQFFRLNFVKFFISFTFLIRVSLISSLMWYIHNIWWLPVFVPQLTSQNGVCCEPTQFPTESVLPSCGDERQMQKSHLTAANLNRANTMTMTCTWQQTMQFILMMFPPDSILAPCFVEDC